MIAIIPNIKIYFLTNSFWFVSFILVVAYVYIVKIVIHSERETKYRRRRTELKCSNFNNISANTTNISKNIKDAGINLYTIAFSTTEVSFYTTDPTDGWWGDDGTSVKLNPSTWMSGFATRNFSANNAL